MAYCPSCVIKSMLGIMWRMYRRIRHLRNNQVKDFYEILLLLEILTQKERKLNWKIMR